MHVSLIQMHFSSSLHLAHVVLIHCGIVGVGVSVGLGVGSGAGVGLGVGSGAGVGLGVGSGAGVGLGVGSGTGAGLGVGSGAGIGLGVGSGAGVGLGVGSGAVPVFPLPSSRPRCNRLKFPFNISPDKCRSMACLLHMVFA